MNIKAITTIAAIGLLPISAFTQTPPTPPQQPAPPHPPGVPGHPGHHDKAPKVPMTFLGVELSQLPTVVSAQLGLRKSVGWLVDERSTEHAAEWADVQQHDR